MEQAPASHENSGAGIGLQIRQLAPADLQAAVSLLAKGMADNPLHVVVFGRDRQHRRRRLQSFFCPLLRHVQANGKLLGGFVDDELVGVLGMLQPGRCQPRWMPKLAMAGAIVGSTTLPVAWRLKRWLGAWMQRDPSEPHWHLGPLVVSATWRRRGIGRELMTCCCEQLDRLSATAWLETDLALNVAFYETLGFAVVARAPVLGVPNWFMRRQPQPLTSRSGG